MQICKQLEFAYLLELVFLYTHSKDLNFAFN